MCGITAVLGKKMKVYQYLFDSLNILRSRGYDSAGIATLTNEYTINKTLNKDITVLLNMKNRSIKSHNGMAHTRWSTHGDVCLNNTHPFLCYRDEFLLIHNGIIRNSHILRQELMEKGVTFRGTTDSEVVCNLISYHYQQNKQMGIENIMKMVFKKLTGYWTICVTHKDNQCVMYVANNETPCLIGITDERYYISSDFNTFANNVKDYITLKQNDIFTLEYDEESGLVNHHIFETYDRIQIDDTLLQESTPYPYDHWYIKEVKEQPTTIKNTYDHKDSFTNKFYNIVDNVDNIILLGSGTSYHAALMGETFLRRETQLNAYAYNASEFELTDIPKQGRTCFLFVSQSGETKDLYDIIVKLKKINSTFRYMSVTNSYNSLIPRNCEFNLYLRMTKEMSVGSTKTFTASVVMLKMITYKIIRKNINPIKNISKEIEKTFECSSDIIESLIDVIDNKNMIFLSSSVATNPIINEVNLKFQELCYVFSLASGAKNLKHGPLALLTKNTPVFFFAPTLKDYEKIMSVANEVKSRGGYNILITACNVTDNVFDKTIKVASSEVFPNLMPLYPMQLLVYHYSMHRGITIDLPKNLAKVVTV